MSGWQPIDTAPMDGTFILLLETDEPHAGDFQRCWVAQYAEGRWWVHGREYTAYFPTHWQPLPEPPQ